MFSKDPTFASLFYLNSQAGVKKRANTCQVCARVYSPSLLGAGLGGKDLGDSVGGPTPSSSELLDGLLPRVKLLLLLRLKYTPLSIICCWAAKLLNCLSCEATVVAAFVLNLDMVKSSGWSPVSWRMTCEGGW